MRRVFVTERAVVTRSVSEDNSFGRFRLRFGLRSACGPSVLAEDLPKLAVQLGGMNVPVQHFAILVDQEHGWQRQDA